MKKKVIYFSLCLLIIHITGCVSLEKKYPDIDRYSISVNPFQQPSAFNGGGKVKVRTFDSVSLFADKTFVFRTGALNYEKDYYNQFILFPTTMITEEVKKWLSSVPQMITIIDRGSLIPAEFEITGKILELYGDIHDKKNPKACLSLEFVVFDIRQIPAKAILRKSYDEQITLERLTIINLVEGWNIALRNIMHDFEIDLRKLLEERK